MRVGIDTSTTLLTKAGTANYINNLVQRLSTKDLEFFEFTPQLYPHKDKEGLIHKMMVLYIDICWLNLKIPYLAKKNRLNILHMPANIIPMINTCKTVVTIHDIAPLLFPRYFKSWHLLKTRLTFKRTVLASNKIITVSEFTKSKIIEFYKVDPNKIKVIYNGKHPSFRPLPKEVVDHVLKKYNLTDSYILTVGTIEPRKNLETIIKSLRILIYKGYNIKLVHVGDRGWLYNDIFNEVKRNNLSDHVIFLGYVPLEDLVAIYNGAKVFVYVSLYEGFGLPVIEAMGCGCPVVTSKGSSLQEIAADAAILVNPRDKEEIVASIEQLIREKEFAIELIQRGFFQAEQFSWERCAEETLETYLTL